MNFPLTPERTPERISDSRVLSGLQRAAAAGFETCVLDLTKLCYAIQCITPSQGDEAKVLVIED